jgi:hypothetical protein
MHPDKSREPSTDISMRTLISLLLLCAPMRGGDVVVVVGQPPAAGGGGTALNTSLIAYWKLDEASGTRADSEGTGTPQDLTENGTIGNAAAVISNGAVIDTSEWLSRADSADLSVGNIDFSIAAWCYITSVSGGQKYFVGKWGGAGAREYLLYYDNGSERFRFIVSDGSSNGEAIANNFGVPTINTYYLVIGYHDSVNNVVGISVNAGTPNTTAWTTGSIDSTTGFAIGALDAATNPSLSQNGRQDETGFWKKVLSGAEITALYNGGAGITCCPFP